MLLLISATSSSPILYTSTWTLIMQQSLLRKIAIILKLSLTTKQLLKILRKNTLPSKKIRRRKRTSINVVLTTTKFLTSTFVTSRLTRVSKYSKNTLHSLATRPISLTNINLVLSIWQVGSKKTILPNKRKLTTTRLNKLLRTYLLLKQRINCLRFSHTKCWHVSTTLIPTNLSMLYATTM